MKRRISTVAAALAALAALVAVPAAMAAYTSRARGSAADMACSPAISAP